MKDKHNSPDGYAILTETKTFLKPKEEINRWTDLDDIKNFTHSSLEFRSNVLSLEYTEQALKDNNFFPVFQAMAQINDNGETEIIKYEALARIKDTRTGRIFIPVNFLDALEQLPLKDGLTGMERMKRQTLPQVLKIAQDYPDQVFSINISSSDLNDSFINFLIEQLKNYNINKNQIILELLEEIEDKNLLEDFLTRLKKEGIHIAIDDYGEKNSNLERVKQLEKYDNLTCVKFDGWIVKGLVSSEKELRNKSQRAIYQLYNELYKHTVAKKTNITLVAEFVESQEVFQALKDIKHNLEKIYLNTDLITWLYQGYHIARPLDLINLPQNIEIETT